jgi:hypothetical protein
MARNDYKKITLFEYSDGVICRTLPSGGWQPIDMDDLDLLTWVENRGPENDDPERVLNALLDAIEMGEFDGLMPAWEKVAPRIRAALEDIKATEEGWRELKWTNRDIERICEWIAETGDPAKLYGKKMRAKILDGLELGAW